MRIVLRAIGRYFGIGPGVAYLSPRHRSGERRSPVSSARRRGQAALFGTAEQVAEKIAELYRSGIDGVLLTFLEFHARRDPFREGDPAAAPPDGSAVTAMTPIRETIRIFGKPSNSGPMVGEHA
jgi:hypothetical protein